MNPRSPGLRSCRLNQTVVRRNLYRRLRGRFVVHDCLAGTVNIRFCRSTGVSGFVSLSALIGLERPLLTDSLSQVACTQLRDRPMFVAWRRLSVSLLFAEQTYSNRRFKSYGGGFEPGLSVTISSASSFGAGAGCIAGCFGAFVCRLNRRSWSWFQLFRSRSWLGDRCWYERIACTDSVWLRPAGAGQVRYRCLRSGTKRDRIPELARLWEQIRSRLG